MSPYKDRQRGIDYLKGYHAGIRYITKHHLGNKCGLCGSTKNLEIHHTIPLNRQARSEQDLKDLSTLALLCRSCHGDRRDYDRNKIKRLFR